MSRQDKATTERHSKLLRELVKSPDNKLCADCKRNDPRWASWNIGVFVCIRCSGIHRGMGTHISKVKSVDLDMWTPEQMSSIQKWGNRRANLYWEAHLKPGHVPPDHKMESFIRSKYESRRWALDGLPPADPSVLDQNSGQETSESAQVPVVAPPQSPPAPQRAISPSSNRPAHVLLSTATATANRRVQTPPLQNRGQVQPQAPAPVPVKPADDLFSLDFHAPPSGSTNIAGGNTSPEIALNKKNDIMSLFSNAPQAAPSGGGGFGNFSVAPTPATTTSMVGNSGVAAWGVQSGWNASSAAPANDLWGNFASASVPQQQTSFSSTNSQPGLFASQNVWSSPTSNVAPVPAFGGNAWATPSSGSNVAGTSTNDPFGAFGSATAPSSQSKKPADDAFGDIWGGFK